MRARNKIIIIVSAILLLAIGILKGVFNDNTPEGKIINIILACFLGVAFIVLVIIVSVAVCTEKKDARLMEKLLSEKNYTEIKTIFEEKSKTHTFKRNKELALYFTLIACFALSDIPSAKTLLYQTDWGFYHRQVKYFEVLLNLKDDDLEKARYNAKDLLSVKKRKQNALSKKTEQIFACIDNNNFEDKFYLDSIYPIVKEIYDQYSNSSDLHLS